MPGAVATELVAVTLAGATAPSVRLGSGTDGVLAAAGVDGGAPVGGGVGIVVQAPSAANAPIRQMRWMSM